MICGNCGHENAEGDAQYCASCGSPLKFAQGKSMLGPYELRGELGRGAMARVWRAWDPTLSREVAIKEPLFGLNLPGDERARLSERFVREARTAARLNHPGIVTIYAADVYDGNRPAIVMELVNGSTLGAILLHDGYLDAPTTLDALDQLLDAVGFAHTCGVVHRDIKPHNIFVRNDGVVKLADFGIAHVDKGGASRFTQAGLVLGTPAYMSPEQARGCEADRRSDLFSVGVVAYEMLVGYNPFCFGGGGSAEVLRRIVNEPVPELSADLVAGLSVDMRPAIMAALSKDPEQRPQSADQFKRMLHGMASDYEVGPRPVAIPSRSRSSEARNGYDEATLYSGPTTEIQDGSTEGHGGVSRWAPAIVAGLCAIALLVILLGASSGGGGGGGNRVITQGSSSTVATTVSASNGTSSSGASAALSSGAEQNDAGIASGAASGSAGKSSNGVGAPSITTPAGEGNGSATADNQAAQQGAGLDAQANEGQASNDVQLETNNANLPQTNDGESGENHELEDQAGGESLADQQNNGTQGDDGPSVSNGESGKSSSSASTKPTSTEKEATDVFVGKWDLVEASQDGMLVTSDELESAKELGFGAYVVFSDDKTLEFKPFDEAMQKGTWKAKNAKEGTAKFESGETVNLKIVNNRLEMSEGGSTLKFEKSKTLKTSSKDGSTADSETGGSSSSSMTLADLRKRGPQDTASGLDTLE